MKLKNLNPLIFILAYFVCYLIVAVFILTVFDYGGKGVELFIISIPFLFYGILIISLLIIFLKFEWVKRNVIIIALMLIIGLLPIFGEIFYESPFPYHYVNWMGSDS